MQKKKQRIENYKNDRKWEMGNRESGRDTIEFMEKSQNQHEHENSG